MQAQTRNRPKPTPTQKMTQTKHYFVPELDNPITEHKVRQAIKHFKTGWARGLDDICGEFLKHADSLVVPFLTNLFNRLYDASHFPLDCFKSVIIPLLKEKATIKTQKTTGEFLCRVSLAKFLQQF